MTDETNMDVQEMTAVVVVVTLCAEKKNRPSAFGCGLGWVYAFSMDSTNYNGS